MGFGIEWAVILLMFLNGGAIGGGDLLDVIPTARYWQAEKITPSVGELVADAGPDEPVAGVKQLVADLGADDFKVRTKAKKKLEDMGVGVLPEVKGAVGSKDSEVAAAATEIVGHLSERGKARAVKRLMAIRTLGEMKEKSAEKLLVGLKDSKELFVGEYAGRALAAIHGEKFEVPERKKAVAGDFGLLPMDTGIAGQTLGIMKTQMNLETAVDLSIAGMEGNPFLGGAQMPKPDREHVLTRVTEEVMKIVDRVGDVRLDGVTLGVAEKVKGETGWVVVIVRGEYDREAMADALKATAAHNGVADAVKEEKVGEMMVLHMDANSAVYMPSDELLVIAGGGADSYAALNGVMLKTLKDGKGGIEGNTKIAELMKGVDRESPAWVVGNVNEELKGEVMLAAFDSFVGSTKRVKEGTDFTVSATGTDAEKVKSATGEMESGIKATLQQIRPMVAAMKGLQPVVDMMESIKFEAKGTGMTMTGEVKDGFFEVMVEEVGAMAVMSMMEEEQRANGKVQGG